MSEHPESGYDTLKGHQTLGEILETAMGFEKTAFEFYRALTGRVGKPIRALVEELVTEEERHYALFAELKAHPDTHAHILDRIKTPPTDHKFSDYIHLPHLDEFPDDQAILQYAMGREQAAMEQYGALAEETPEGPIRDLFTFLAHEELEHKRELEKRYYELVYPSNL